MFGDNFENSPDLQCRFGALPPKPGSIFKKKMKVFVFNSFIIVIIIAVFVSEFEVKCTVPEASTSIKHAVEVSNDGNDNEISFVVNSIN